MIRRVEHASSRRGVTELAMCNVRVDIQTVMTNGQPLAELHLPAGYSGVLVLLYSSIVGGKMILYYRHTGYKILSAPATLLNSFLFSRLRSIFE